MLVLGILLFGVLLLEFFGFLGLGVLGLFSFLDVIDVLDFLGFLGILIFLGFLIIFLRLCSIVGCGGCLFGRIFVAETRPLVESSLFGSRCP